VLAQTRNRRREQKAAGASLRGRSSKQQWGGPLQRFAAAAAQSRASDCRGPRDRFHPVAASRRTTASATKHVSAAPDAGRLQCHECDRGRPRQSRRRRPDHGRSQSPTSRRRRPAERTLPSRRTLARNLVSSALAHRGRAVPGSGSFPALRLRGQLPVALACSGCRAHLVAPLLVVMFIGRCSGLGCVESLISGWFLVVFVHECTGTKAG
jgi:hypothetical protein